MPTLVEVQLTSSQQESMEESTARPSELLWVKNEFRASARETGEFPQDHCNDDSLATGDDSTLSGTLLVEAMEEMRRIHQMRKKEATTEQERMDDGSFPKKLVDSVADDVESQQPIQNHLPPGKEQVGDKEHENNQSLAEMEARNVKWFGTSEERFVRLPLSQENGDERSGNTVRKLREKKHDDGYSSALSNDNSFSRTFSESYFERKSPRGQRDETPTRFHIPPVARGDNINELSGDVHHDVLSRTMNESFFDRTLSQKSSGLKSLKVSFVTPRIERKPGPMEQLYTTKYEDKVRRVIGSFKLSHPVKTIDYRSMSPSQRVKEQRRVLELLERLKIATLSARHGEGGEAEHNDVSCTKSNSQRHINNEGDAIVLEEVNKSLDILSSTFPSVSHSRDETMEKSWALLSPAADSAVDQLKDCSIESRYHKQSQVFTPESPIELTRAAAGYRSPVDVVDRIRKRGASMSGKRGTDSSRARLDKCTVRALSNNETPSKVLEELDRSLGRHEENKIFTASESPISPYGTGPVTPGEFSCASNISFGEERSDNHESQPRPSFASIEETMVQDRSENWSINGAHCNQTANVYLKTGKSAHFPPLDVERNRRERRAPPTQTFPDPLVSYSDHTHRRLRRLYNWIRRKDANKAGQGLVLSLKSTQLMDIVLKMLLDDTPVTQNSDQSMGMRGGTLIVARSKEDLVEWSRTFREGSALSVLNHATLPLQERKANATTAKCSHYDVVLTTFDAMKSPDSNIPLNGKGIASVKDQQPSGEWYRCRSQSESLQCRQLSVLHQLHWGRIIFADILGKKCFLTKPGTSRHSAATALSSQSRFVFVIGSPEKGASLAALVKANKDALLAMAGVLQMDKPLSEAKVLLEQSFADFHDSSTYR